MENKIKTIGVLTSGGDAPGMNAAIRAVVRTGAFYGVKVLGVKRGYNGLINGDMEELAARSVSETLQKGGTILQTARCAEFREEAGVRKGIEMARANGIEGLIVIGGDGSFRGARDLSRMGLPTIAIPGTIDNDISCTEYTIGYDTCLNTVQDAVDKLRDTSSSHDRCSVIEVMGHGAGYIALNTGIACGAEAVILPEVPYDFERDVIAPIMDGKARGKKHSIVIVSEQITNVIEMAEMITKRTGIESRATILGHVQRGGTPTVRDRVLASEMGNKAVELLLEGKSNRIVCMQNNKLMDVDIEEGLSMKKQIPENMLELVNKLRV